MYLAVTIFEILVLIVSLWVFGVIAQEAIETKKRGRKR